MRDAKWEAIPSFITGGDRKMHSARLPVPGGWLVSTIAEAGSYSGGIAVSQIFIVDSSHDWQLGSQPANRVRKSR